ncbi:MAG TPA: dephospho-CoA kinase [Flavisolibacter sp.]|nr:dephospho-CoA kinase [Flavisolibacter sp.]
MLKIGLTGGIGSGKSTVARLFELLNVPVYYADEASKRLYHTHAGLMASLRQHFGEDIYAGNQLNRQALASIVFNDPQKLALLNRLVHPLTITDAAEWMDRQQAPYVVKEAAIIFESGSAAGLDYIIGVYAPRALRIKRVMDRDGLTREEVTGRMDRQINEEIKMKLCDFVLTNNEQELLIPQVLRLHARLVEQAMAQ